MRHRRAELATEGVAASLPPGSSGGLLESLAGFVKELRNAGIPVSLTENLDAVEALRHIPLEDRDAFKYALAATMVKNNAHWKTFETVFEVYFSLRGREYHISDDGRGRRRPRRDLLTELLVGPRAQGEGGKDRPRGLTPEQLRAEMLFCTGPSWTAMTPCFEPSPGPQ